MPRIPAMQGRASRLPHALRAMPFPAPRARGPQAPHACNDAPAHPCIGGRGGGRELRRPAIGVPASLRDFCPSRRPRTVLSITVAAWASGPRFWTITTMRAGTAGVGAWRLSTGRSTRRRRAAGRGSARSPVRLRDFQPSRGLLYKCLSLLDTMMRAASYTFRRGPLKVTVWPRSFPWLIEWRSGQWWLFDRGQNVAPARTEEES